MKTIQDRIRGSLVGGAMGDALGYPVEFLSYKNILERYGDCGITRLDTYQHWLSGAEQAGKSVVSDDTQMTLYTANGLLNAKRMGKPATVGILEAYLEWYFTQVGMRSNRFRDCWISNLPELNKRRAPGMTCMSALESLLRAREPVNYSKGCGGVMRIAPIALYAVAQKEEGSDQSRLSIQEADLLAGDAARLTHKHPLGYIPAALESHLIYRLVQDGQPTRKALVEYLYEGFEEIGKLYPHYSCEIEELSDLMNRAVSLSSNGQSDVDNIKMIGEGWVGDEALAIAYYCALRYIGSFEDALIAAVNHSGDSDSTGAVCGNIIGAAIGYELLPQVFKDDLELLDVILQMADDLYSACCRASQPY